MKTLVVGAGGGGLASALLGALRGEEVTLLESHSHLGGCASYFKRGPFVFDVGATTISGVSPGEPLGELFKLLNSKPELYPADPGIVFQLSNGRKLSYYRDFDRWMEELHEAFPHLDHRPFWELVRKINAAGWAFMNEVHTFPFKNILDLAPLLKHPKHFLLLPHLLVSTEMMLKHYGLVDPLYSELMSGILIISAQTSIRDTPFLVGAMGLSYPAETYAPVGGMKGLMDFFEKELNHHKVKLQKKTHVQSFGSKWVKVQDEKIKTDRLILNVPIWNLAALNEGPQKPRLVKEENKHPGFWGAFTVYLGVKGNFTSLYHQVHLKNSEVENYFVSFSDPRDHARAPEGYQAVSISIHVKATDWMHLGHSEYERKKDEWGTFIVNDFCRRFGIEETKFITFGTPRTFEDYTDRKSGFVGGIPFKYGKNPFGLLSPVMGENLYRVGDTVFPGQGLCGVVAGALALHRRLTE